MFTSSRSTLVNCLIALGIAGAALALLRPSQVHAQFSPQRLLSQPCTACGATDVHTADLDGDGDQDVLAASQGNNKVIWYENDGSGGVVVRDTIASSAVQAKAVHTADLDGDGDQDVLTASVGDDTVAWYENDGAGNFSEERIIAQSGNTAPRDLVAADLTGNGLPDVVAANSRGNEVVWYENNGDGTFASASVVASSVPSVRAIQAADVNGNGAAEVISSSRSDDYILLHPNNGDGTFATADTVTTNVDGPSSLFTADLTGDGNPDLLSASTFDDRIAWYENNGEGGFSTQNTITTGVSAARSVAAADLTGSGTPDVLAVSNADGEIVWYENDGTGTFSGPTTITTDVDAPESVHTADLTGNGTPDVLSASRLDDKVAWYENDGTGSFSTQRLLSLQPSADAPVAVQEADLTGDGNLDVVAAARRDNALVWYENNGDGTLAPQATLVSTSLSPQDLHAADYDGDGTVDVAVAGADTIRVFPGNGDGTLAAPQPVAAGVNGEDLYAADLTGNGSEDLLVATGFENEILWYENAGDGTFTSQGAITTNVDAAQAVYAADLTGNGSLDVLSGSEFDDRIAWYENNGDGTFGSQQNIEVGTREGLSIAAADLTGSGAQDVVVGSLNGVAWFENDGSGTFSSANVVTVSNRTTPSVQTPDLTGNGHPDILTARQGVFGGEAGLVAWHVNDGTGSFTEEQPISENVYTPQAVAAADLTGDGQPDVLSASLNDDKVAWHENALIPPAPLAISETKPKQGAPGTAVRIYGTGFSTTASENTVEFGEATATVVDAAGNVIYAQVPSGVSGPVDVTVTTPDSSVTAANRFSVVTGGGYGFEEVPTDIAGVQFGDSDVGDVNGDGRLDLVVAGADSSGTPRTTLYLNQGEGTFAEANAGLVGVEGDQAVDTEFGDVNGDGALDLLVTGTDVDGGAVTALYLNDGQGGFARAEAGLTNVSNSAAAFGDVTGNGALDLVVTGMDLDLIETATLYLNQGNGTFQAAEASSSLTGVRNGSAAFADVDNDGDLDLLLTGQDGSSRTTTLYENDGQGGFTVMEAGLPGIIRSSVDFGDVNNDGALDLLLTGDGSTSTLYQNDGTGSFTALDEDLMNVGLGSGALGDVDGDGWTDLVIAGDTSGTVVYQNEEGSGFSPFGAGLKGVEISTANWGDLTGDGTLDLFVSGDTTGAIGGGGPAAFLYDNLTSDEVAPPDIAVQPSSLSETLALGDSSTQSLQIENPAPDSAQNLQFEVSVVGGQAGETAESTLKNQRPRLGAGEWGAMYDGTQAPTTVVEPKSHDGSPPLLVDDPVGDADSIDVDRVRAGVENGQINVVIEHTEQIDPANYGGYMSFDVDQDSSTGVDSGFENPDQVIGAEYQVTFFELGSGTIPLIDTETFETISELSVSADSTTLHFSVPLDAIDGALPMNITGVVGSQEGPTDWFPNAGNATIGVNWLAVSPASGSVAPGNSQSVEATVSATGTPPGDYEATIRVTSNDPEQDTVEVPVSLVIERPGIALNNPEGLPAPGEGAEVAIDLPSIFTPTGGSFFYRRAGARTFDSTAVDVTGIDAGGTISVSIPGSAVTETGVQYYVQLRGQVASGGSTIQLRVPSSAPIRTGFLPVQTSQVQAQGTFEPETYRMLSIPLALGDRSAFEVLEQQFGSYDPSTWKFARWAPSDSSYRFGSAVDSLRPGQAAWLTTAAGDSLTVPDARSANASGARTIPLDPGWNQIGTPFPFPVAWGQVDRPASVRTPFAYDSTGYRSDVPVLRPWRGYFVYNRADSAVTLRVPPVAALSDSLEGQAGVGRSLAKAASANGYRLQPVATFYRNDRSLQDRATWLGFDESAEAGFGPKDRAKPPAVGPHVRLAVTPEAGPPLARSLKPVPSDGAVWDLRVGLHLDQPLRSSQEVTVVLNEEGRRPSGFQRYVVDRDRERRLPVTNGSVTVELTEAQPTRRLRVIVGTEAFAQRNSEGAALTIEETKLRANAPNPFTESTTIPYQLAEQERVTIAIYDLLGRRVRTLVDGTKRAGTHQAEWRPGQGEKTLASGIYFCRMEAGDYTATRKLVLVR